MTASLSIGVWTKDYVPRGPVVNISEAKGSIRWNVPGEFSFTVDADHPRIGDLAADGSRAVVTFRERPGAEADVIFSGPVTEVVGTDSAAVEKRTFSIADDWQIFNEIVGLPNPTGTMTQQGDDGAYFTRTGPAETVLKQILQPNATRQGVALTIPATQGRGDSITVSMRMHPLADRLFPAVTNAGLGVRVLQLDGSRVLDVYTPQTRPRVVTEASGAILSGDFSLTDPTLTRVIVGAGGEGEARAFREFVATGPGTVLVNPAPGLAGIELIHGVSRSAHVDARDIPANDPNLVALLQERAIERLTEGAAKVSLTAALAETGTFRYPTGFDLGDEVTIRFRGSGNLTDRVREIAFDYTEEGGLVITPLVGDWQESADDALYRAVAEQARALRDLQTR